MDRNHHSPRTISGAMEAETQASTSKGRRSEPMARSVYALRSHVPRSVSQVMTAETKERLHETKVFT